MTLIKMTLPTTKMMIDFIYGDNYAVCSGDDDDDDDND